MCKGTLDSFMRLKWFNGMDISRTKWPCLSIVDMY